MYIFSMLLVIVASVLYHVSQKSIDSQASVGLSMIVTYGVALVLSIVFVFVSEKKIMIDSFKHINYASYLLGVSIFILEMGYLLVYRSGWDIKYASLFANVLTGLILVALGLLFFKEKMSLTNIAGIALSIIGLILIRK